MTEPTPLGPGAEERPVLTVRCPEDLLALAAVMLGFVPDDSVAMLTFGAEQAFHARSDLPHDPEDLAEVVKLLLEPARRHRVPQAAFVVYTDAELVARRLARLLRRECENAGVGVIEILRADGSRWFPLLRPGSTPAWGVPYDISSHAFVAEAVLRGQVTHASRGALAETLRPDPAAQHETTAKVDALGPRWRQSRPPAVDDIRREGRWVARMVAGHVEAGTAPDDAEVARLLRVIQVVWVRDAAWSTIDRRSAQRHVHLWTTVCRRAPSDLLAPAAAMLGWAAWQAGHGALAWCAHDLAVDADPDYTLTDRLADILENAVPPSVWEGGWDWEADLAHLRS